MPRRNISHTFIEPCTTLFQNGSILIIRNTAFRHGLEVWSMVSFFSIEAYTYNDLRKRDQSIHQRDSTLHWLCSSQ